MPINIFLDMARLLWALSLTAAGGRLREGEKAQRSELYSDSDLIPGTARGDEVEDAAGSFLFHNLIYFGV